MNKWVFIYRTYHIVSQGGLQFYLSEIGRQLVIYTYWIALLIFLKPEVVEKLKKKRKNMA